MSAIQNLIDAVRELRLVDVSKEEDLFNLADEASTEFARLEALADAAEDRALNAMCEAGE